MRLQLMKEEDLQLVLSWRNSPEVRKNMYTKHEITWSEHVAWFNLIKINPKSLWYMYLDIKNKPQGVIYFTQYDGQHRNAFWGFYSASDAPTGTGIRMEYTALNHAFSQLNLHKLNCEVIESNIKVINMHKKVGFHEEGIFREFHFNGIAFENVIRMGLIKSEWEKNRQRLFNRIEHIREC